jgi:P27 family predicted phage terminase small subunit
MGVLTRIDSNALELYCDTFARWLDAVASLQKHSSVMAIRDKAGTIIGYADRPEVARADRLLSQIQRLGSRFGLTPADRVALCGAANKPAQRASGQGKVTYLNLGERTG